MVFITACIQYYFVLVAGVHHRGQPCTSHNAPLMFPVSAVYGYDNIIDCISCKVCCALHPHAYFVTTKLYVLIPSPFVPSPSTSLLSGDHEPFLCVYESASIWFVP